MIRKTCLRATGHDGRLLRFHVIRVRKIPVVVRYSLCSGHKKLLWSVWFLSCAVTRIVVRPRCNLSMTQCFCSTALSSELSWCTYAWREGVIPNDNPPFHGSSSQRIKFLDQLFANDCHLQYT